MKRGVLLIVAVLFVGGCETMFAHWRLQPHQIKTMAEYNAKVNYCLAKSAIEQREVYEGNYYSAMLLDITIVDEEYFKSNYTNTFDSIKNSNNVQYICGYVRKNIPEWTQTMKSGYYHISQWLSKARATEVQQISNTLSSMGNQIYSNTNFVTYKMPPIEFNQSTSTKNDLYLIQTGSGLRQCRTTSKNYVFCI